MKKLIKFGFLAATFFSANVMAQCSTLPGAWDAVNTGANPANDLSVTDVNPIDGACSLVVPLEFGGKRYVEDQMGQETSFRMSFKIDTNSITLPIDGLDRRIKVASVLCVDGGNGCAVSPNGVQNFQGWWQTKLRQQAGGYRLGSWVQGTDGTRISHTVPLVDGCNTVEIQLIAGNPGTYKMWVNNTDENNPDYDVTTVDPALDLSGAFTDIVRIGKTATGQALIGTDQFFLLDSYESRRQTFIGDSCAP